LRPRDEPEPDVGLVPLDTAVALSNSGMWVTSRGESGVGIRLRSAWVCDGADEAVGETNMSAGGAARVSLSVECDCPGGFSGRTPDVLGLECDADCAGVGVFSILAPEAILGLELSPDCDVRGLASGVGSSACCLDGSVVLLDAEVTSGREGKVIECGLLLKSV
jgi:hypothetical protein